MNRLPPRRYRQSRTCATCKHIEKRELDELQAAFEHGRAWRGACSSCGSRGFKSSTCELPLLSEAQLAAWSTDKNLRFIPQDEIILLAADPDRLDLLFQAFDSPDTLRSKRKRLLAALFIMISDHLEGRKNAPDVVQRVVAGLEVRRERVAEINARVPGDVRKHLLPRLPDILRRPKRKPSPTRSSSK